MKKIILFLSILTSSCLLAFVDYSSVEGVVTWPDYRVLPDAKLKDIAKEMNIDYSWRRCGRPAALMKNRRLLKRGKGTNYQLRDGFRCSSIKRNINFDFHQKCRPSPKDLLSARFKDGSYPFRARLAHAGALPLYYQYTNNIVDGVSNIVIKVALKNSPEDLQPNDKKQLKKTIAKAEELWNIAAFKYEYPMKFHFHLVDKPEDAYFRIKLKDDTRGPYHKRWTRGWGTKIVAHEFAHMMGINDEYKIIMAKSFCDEESIMCRSFRGRILEDHLYAIYRRNACHPAIELE